MKKRLLIGISLIILSAVTLYLLMYKETPGKVRVRERPLMGTIFSIKTFGNLSKKDFTDITSRAFEEIRRLEGEMSEYDPKSPISTANKYAGEKEVPITEDIARVISLAVRISKDTEGAFDISFKPLGRLWNVKKRKIPPHSEEIQIARKRVNFRHIVLDEKARTLFLEKAGMEIGLGGIAKGYAARRAGEVLTKAGLDNFIINAGGDLYYSGRKNGTPWTCGIRDPDVPGDTIRRYSIIKNCAVATSGDYERYFVHEGKRYHHIIDPQTGYPAEDTRSVTVFAKDPALADAYATAFFILGRDKAVNILKNTTGLAFIMVDGKGAYYSGNIDEFVR